jgi:L-Ala-D/L-Glu epimerase
MIRAVVVHVAKVPMECPFMHAGFARDTSEAVLVELDLDGERGWGEGAPRTYVTGESAESVVVALSGLDLSLLDTMIDWESFNSAIASLAQIDLPRLVGGLAPAPAAAAALEIALLDGLCRLHGRPLADVLAPAGGAAESRRMAPEPVIASLVIDLTREPQEVLGTLPAGCVNALRHVKVKAARELDATLERVEQAREGVPENVRISLDVNGAWAPQLALTAARQLKPFGLAWLEEPTEPRKWSVLRRLREESGVGVMLDESCLDRADLEHAAGVGAATHVNVRISKCGGVLRSAALAEQALGLGLGYQLGVQVGEAGPLWAAGRMLATMLRHAETIEAGRQDEWFAEPLTVPAYAIDRSRQQVLPLDGPGTGIVPSEALLRHAVTRARWRNGAWAMEAAA